MNTPLYGAACLIEGFRLITKPGLRRFVLVPTLINILLFVGLFIVARHYVTEFNLWFNHWLPTWLQWLSWVLWFLFFASFFLFMVYAFVIIANIISAPFNSFLAEKVEYYLTGQIQEPRTLWENIKDIPRIIGRQLSILGYYLPRAVLVLLLLFVPVVQVFVSLIWFLFHAWFMSMTYLDYPTDNHRIPIRNVRVWLAERRWASFGFGVSVLIASMIPVVNLVTIPAAVAGATRFWLDANAEARVCR